MLTPWHQTLVIGNGFDLQCGLASRFLDFFEDRRKRLYAATADSNSSKSFGTRLDEQGLTVWDLVLDHQPVELWNDVESAIAEWTTDPSFYRKVLKQIAEARTRATLTSLADLHVFISKPSTDNLYFVIARFLLDVYPDLPHNPTESSLNAVFFDELSKLENDFCDYLSSQVDGNMDYRDKAQALFLNIASKGTPDPALYSINTSILSFNYTEPELRWGEKHTSIHTVNIHGRLDGEIIIGIDGKGRMTDELALPFTKTYRLMSRKKRLRYDSSYTDHDALICGKVDAIKFYGHSLSEADYSYFQAMFDATDLYGGSTTLAFYHRPCSGADVEAARTEVMKNAVSLLSAYGTTLDNKDHGNNLIHKLLLEDRLFVESVR